MNCSFLLKRQPALATLILFLLVLIPAEVFAGSSESGESSPDVAIPACVSEDVAWKKWKIKITTAKVAEFDLEGAGKIWAAIPSSSEMQQVHSVVFSSEPHLIYTDPVYGNSIAEFKTRFYRSHSFSETIEVSLLEGEWSIDASTIGEYDRTDPEIERYLQATSILQANHLEVQQAATDIIGSETNPYRKAQLILNFVYRYGIGNRGTRSHDTLTALRTRSGGCSAFAYLFAGLARAAGIPARVATGLALLAPGTFDVDGGPNHETSWHLWNEIYLPGCGWIPVDATEGTIGVLGGDRIVFSKGCGISLSEGGPTKAWFHIPVASLDRWSQDSYCQMDTEGLRMVVSCLDNVVEQEADRDGDGVPDDEDYCPDFPGRKETNGC